MSEVAVTPLPRRGRLWILLALLLSAGGLGYAIVNIAVQKPAREIVHVSGIESAQEIFGGVPQEGDRLGSSDAPVSIQVFADLQCSSCQADFLDTIPGLVERFARPGTAKFLLRHYSVAENAVEQGFFGAEAAARQGYGWQYTYLFFRNQAEADRFEVDQKFMVSLAGSIGELDVPEWEHDYETEHERFAKILEGYDQLGTDLGIRTKPAEIVTGPGGTRTLQDGPSLSEIEGAIGEVR